MSLRAILALLLLALTACTTLPPPGEWGREISPERSPSRTPVNRPEAPEIRKLDWPQALRVSRERNPSLRAAHARLQRAHAIVDETKALFYPAVDTRGAAISFLEAADFRGRTGSNVSEQSTRSRFFTGRGAEIYSAGLDVTYPIFDGGDAYYASRAAEAFREAERQLSTNVLDELEVRVSTAFLNALLAEGGVRIAEEALRFSTEQETQAASREKAGEGLRVDTLRFATRASEERQALNRARAERRVQLAILSELLGVTVADDVELVRPEKLLDFVEGDLTAMALENRADVRAMRAQVEEAGLRVRREESSWWPAVNVFGSYGFISLDDLDLGTDKDEFQIGAALAMNLFEGGATSARINARKQQLEELHSQERELALAVERQVRQFGLEFEVARKNVEVSRETVRLAEEVLTRVAARYREGEAQVLDVTEAELQRTRAQLSFLRSRVNSLLSQVRLRRALGLGLLRE